MNSNWFKLVIKATNVRNGKGILLKGVPVVFNKRGAELSVEDNSVERFAERRPWNV